MGSDGLVKLRSQGRALLPLDMGNDKVLALSAIRQNFDEAQAVLSAFATEANFEAIERAGELMVSSLKAGGKIISCGNGGSMCDAMHFAEELSGRYRDNRPAIAALSLSDPSHLTCVGNDYGFEQVFSRGVEALGRPGDVLLAISTSGNSSNVLRAAQAALKQNMSVVALTGKDGGKLGPLATVELRVPHGGYADRIQEIHIKIIHTLIQRIEQGLFG